MKKKYLLFDFDGVLAESVNIKTEAFRKMYLSHGEDFANKVVEFHEANGGVSRYEKFKVFNGDWLGETITEEKVNELADVFSNLVVKGVVNAQEVKGANEFLETSKKYTKFIITGTPTIEIKPILEQRKILEKDRAAELLEAFDVVNTLRLKAQLEYFRDGKEIDNEVDTHSLGKIERDLLKDSFKIVNGFKKFITSEFKIDKIM